MLNIADVLGRLKGVRESGQGQYMASCPCHDDKKASLAVRMGNKGIVMHCLAGCETEDIVKALGFRMADLCEGEDQSSTSKVGDKTKTAKESKAGDAPPKAKIAAKPFTIGGYYTAKHKDSESGELKTRKEKITAVYRYTDAEGKPVLEVARTEEKSFPVIHMDGGKWYWSDGGKTAYLYRLPRMMEGIKSGKRIWLVEGEKDVDTLERMGLFATTNKGGAGKWKKEDKEISPLFRGAKVCIIPDLDDPGRKHARAVAKELEPYAREIRILNLRKICGELPDKGDVSDLAQKLGEAAASKALEEGIQRAPVMSRIVDDSSYADYFDGIRGYSVQNGCISHYVRDSWSPLCNFTALPIEEIIQDDGTGELRTSFRVIGWANDGRRLPEVVMTAETFAGMQWPLKMWGLVANVKSGNGVRERLREAMQAAGDRSALRKTSYRHTGWRKIEGRPVYLHGGGGIGCDDAIVELDYGFNRYDLSGVVRGPAMEMDAAGRFEYCVMQLMRMMSVAGYRVGAPLISYMFLSPLRHFLMQEGHRPSFIPFLRGRTGSGKSVMASLVLNCFGRDFSYDTAHPASFDDTINGISLKLFTLKDMPLLIDDYHPEENP